MENDDDKQQLNLKRDLLIKAMSKVISNLVTKSGKSGRKISAEFDIGLGLLSKVMRGKSDIKFTTFWKISDAIGISQKDFITKIEKELPKNFNFFE